MEQEVGFPLAYQSSAEVTLKRIGRKIKKTLGGIKSELKVKTEAKIPVSHEAWILVRLVLRDYVKASEDKKKQRGEKFCVGKKKKFNQCKRVFGEDFFFYLERLPGLIFFFVL